MFRRILNKQSAQLGDEPSTAIAQKNLQHFDHTFKAQLHTVTGPILTPIFGGCSFAKRPAIIICKGPSITIVEEQGISSKLEASIYYTQISAIAWDHGSSEVKLNFKPVAGQQADGTAVGEDSFLILTLANSIEFEGELKLRLQACASQTQGWRPPAPMYVGMFAGATKPKPFQRKRPNLSSLAAGKLPPLQDMRAMAVDLHRGSYKPCAQGQSRRFQVALQHIYEGLNTFPLLNVRGASSISNQYRSDSLLVITEDALVLKPHGAATDTKIEFAFEDIVDWNAVDNDSYRSNDSGIEIISGSGESVFFGVPFIRDAKHSLEYFWNRHKVANGSTNGIKLGSTHGRPIVTIATLSGDLPPPPESEQFQGQTEVLDQDGLVVRPGGKIAPRRGSMVASAASKDVKVVPPENRAVKNHWHHVVMHQGWLLKQGGVGVGSIKNWLKRYFVLYKTSQGHFLVYYSDFTECPLYTSEQNHRNHVDLAKCTFIRPGSNKQNQDTPPHSFDIVTIEREWTLCAETQENAQRWLQLLNRAVDEDVAILPDEELVFKVKPKVDPLGMLPATDYSTALKVSSYGISVCTPIPGSKDGSEREHFFWVYTDFYKWSLLSQEKKLALLVNVFADSSFSRRNEYIFRNKEAPRLATAIEFFIEKFMSLMHIRLETVAGAFDDVASLAASAAGKADSNNEASSGTGSGAVAGLHELSAEDLAHHADEVDDIDLLGLDMNLAETEPTNASGNHTIGHSLHYATAEEAVVRDSEDDSIPIAEASLVDPFAAPLSATSTAFTAPIAVGKATAIDTLHSDPFGSDPFGDDPFGAPAAASAFSSGAPAPAKVAPPLTPQQVAQHNAWKSAILGCGEGPIYDDGTLQIAAKIEVRGSQARLTFYYNNQSPGSLSDFKFSISDPIGLIRFELGAVDLDFGGLSKRTQVLMMECLKPGFPGPEMTIHYKDQLKGLRTATLDLPIVVTTFNEPLSLKPEDFTSRWQLTAGQEAQEVIRPSFAIVPADLYKFLYQTMKFGKVDGMPDATEFIVYGASSLRTGASNPAGEKISVGSLVKLEMNVQANAVRITFRTVHSVASTALLQNAKRLLL